MTDQDNPLQGSTDDTEGHGFKVGVTTDDDSWIKDGVAGQAGSVQVIFKAADGDVEGHAMGKTIALRAFDDEDDTEGHAVSVHFPSREEADAFRRRLMLAGVLTGTIVLGAAGGIGLANLSNADAAGAGAATGAGSAAGMDWTQAERPDAAAAGAGSAAGMDWTQAERPDAAAAGAGDAAAPTGGGARPE